MEKEYPWQHLMYADEYGADANMRTSDGNLWAMH